jgi:hypothetical protein
MMVAWFAASVWMAVMTSADTVVGAVTPLLTVAFAAAWMIELPVLADATLSMSSSASPSTWNMFWEV